MYFVACIVSNNEYSNHVSDNHVNANVVIYQVQYIVSENLLKRESARWAFVSCLKSVTITTTIIYQTICAYFLLPFKIMGPLLATLWTKMVTFVKHFNTDYKVVGDQ